MSNITTVDELVQEIRDQVDEQNTAGPKTDASILRVLNRGLRLVNGILARHYPEPLITSQPVDLTGGTASYAIPEDCFEDRVEYVEISIPGSPAQVFRRRHSDRARLHTSGRVATPLAWYVQGRSIVFAQTPSGTYDASIHYVRRLNKLVKAQGRITDVGATYVTVDDVGEDISTSTSETSSYVNIVDWRTGEIKFTGQVASTTDGRLSLRATPERSTVLGRSVSGSAGIADSDVDVDDYVCLIHGTCVPFFQDSIASYLEQYSVSEITRSTGGDARLEQQILRDVEARTAAAWDGREYNVRVQNRSGVFPSYFYRYPVTNG